MNNKKGFTLVELLVVIAIIGLLSTMAVIGLGSIREKSRDTKRVADMQALYNAMEMVKTELGDYTKANCVPSGTVPEVVATCGAGIQTFLPNVGNMHDPLHTTAAPLSACTAAQAAGTTCDYAFTTLPTTTTYVVTFMLEKGVGSLSLGRRTVTPTGVK